MRNDAMTRFMRLSPNPDTLLGLLKKDLYDRRRLSRKTLEADHGTLSRLFDFLQQDFQIERLHEIERWHLTEYQESLKPKLAVRSVNTYTEIIRAFFRRHPVVDEFGETVSIADHLRVTPRTRRRKSKAPSEQSFKRVLDYISNLAHGGCEQAIRDLFFVCFITESSMRRGELHRVTVREMDEIERSCGVTERKSVLINGRLTHVPVTVYVCESVGKTGVVEGRFSETTMRVYRLWRPTLVKHGCRFVCMSLHGKNFGKRMVDESVSLAIRRRCREAGIEKPFATHALRHYFAQRAVPLLGEKTTAWLMNHSSTKVLQTNYFAPQSQHLDQGAAQMSLPIVL